MNFHHYSHHALSIDDELLHRNNSFIKVLSIIQNLSYCSDECNNCSCNMLFMIMLDAYLSDLFLLLQKIYFAYYKILTCFCTCSEYNSWSNDSAFYICNMFYFFFLILIQFNTHCESMQKLYICNQYNLCLYSLSCDNICIL